MQDFQPFVPSFDGLPDALFAVSLSGEILYLNQAAELTFGLRRRATIGRNFLDTLASPEHADAIRDKLRRSIETGSGSFECVCRKADGSPVCADFSLRVVDGAQDPVRHLLVSLRDITQQTYQRQSTSLANRFRGLLESAPDAMVIVNASGAIVLLNAQAEKQFGFPHDELLGQPVKNIIPRGFAERLLADGQRSTEDALAQQIGTGIELIGRRKDGTHFPIEIMLSPLESTEGILVSAAIRDITVRKRTEEHLAQMEARYRGLLEAAPDAMVVVDSAGLIVLLNVQAEKQFGYRRDELLGQPVKNIIPVGFTERLVADGLRTAAEALAQQIGMGIELIGRRKNGTGFPIEIMLSPLESADGILVTAAIRDISEKKAAEALRQSEEPFRLLIESVKDYAIMMLDLDGRVVSWNLGAQRIKGYREEEILGRNFSCFYPPEDVEAGKPERELRRAAEDGRFEDEGLRVRKDGSRFWANAVITRVRDDAGRPYRFVNVIRDVTEQKEQYQRIEEANRLKSEFLANMSHELRTPLNAIIGFSELMHDGKVGPVSPDHKEYLGDILTSSRHLLQLINDVLDLAKVESGKMEFRPEPVDAERLIAEVGNVLRTLAAQKRIQIDVEVDPRAREIVADPAKLKQVLYNYLSNALKFSPDGGRVRVGVAAVGETELRIEVEDTGIGIQPADLGRLFVEFHQLDASTAKRYPGTGLGLALTKRIVEAQGGRVGVESTPGKGSTFFAILPRVPASTPAVEAKPASPALASPCVLVIEDDRKDREWLVQALAREGYSVDAAATGAEGVELARLRNYDAITIDFLLPDLAGGDVLGEVRSGRNRDTPVIVASVLVDKGAMTGIRVHDVLQKPIQLEQLLGSLDRAAVARGGARPILVVDDDRSALKLSETTLQRLGYRAICLQSARMALQAAEAETPAAVILDLLMPDMDGFEFLEKFRATPGGRRVPVIVWSSKDITAEEREVLHRRTQGIISKGQGTAELIAVLRAQAPLPPAVEEPG